MSLRFRHSYKFCMLSSGLKGFRTLTTKVRGEDGGHHQWGARWHFAVPAWVRRAAVSQQANTDPRAYLRTPL
eukprot:3996608-Pleurochrysis_carterae.AAC.1